MKYYTIKKGETLETLAIKFDIQDPQKLREFHNKHCALEHLIGKDVKPGFILCVPNFENIENHPAENTTPQQQNAQDQENTPQSTTQDQETQDQARAEHAGKHVVIQRGKAQCNQGSQCPQFKVTSHKKHYYNSPDNNPDYLAVTEDDLQFTPAANPFGSCALKNGNPCTYAPASKWQKPYPKINVMNHKVLTEISYLPCATGGKITVNKHGQESETGKNQIKKANAKEQRIYNPFINFEEFQKETTENYLYDYE